LATGGLQGDLVAGIIFHLEDRDRSPHRIRKLHPDIANSQARLAASPGNFAGVLLFCFENLANTSKNPKRIIRRANAGLHIVFFPASLPVGEYVVFEGRLFLGIA
jgi:hypothetical protein